MKGGGDEREEETRTKKCDERETKKLMNAFKKRK